MMNGSFEECELLRSCACQQCKWPGHTGICALTCRCVSVFIVLLIFTPAAFVRIMEQILDALDRRVD